MAFRSLLLSLFAIAAAVNAVTVYNQKPLATTDSTTAAAASYTGSAAYNPTVLIPPPLPEQRPATEFPITLMPQSNMVPGISIPANGAFFGFSIEMSVVNQVVGPGSKFINVPFLNLMSLLVERAGRVHVRVGGNTQDYAVLVDATPDGRLLEKVGVDPNNPTATPTVIFSIDMLYMMANASQFTNINWYLGVPLNDTSNLRLQIAEEGERILGDKLLGFQIGNEPDLYLRHNHRLEGYGPKSYYDEFGQVMRALQSDTSVPVKNNLIGPNLALADWTFDQFWSETTFLPDYADVLTALTVEHYPDNNCAAIYAGMGTPKDPQTVFADYLTHNSGVNLIRSMLSTSMLAQQYNKQFIMFETNTASCGGFAGISNSFGSALWALDYGLQMAYSNFTHALLHIGGQNVYYNPFTPPPTNQSAFHQWTIGPIFYSTLIMTEVLGNTNNSRIMDLGANSGSDQTPGYAIYENDQIARVALFNYMTDPTGSAAYTASISIGGGQTGQPGSTPTSVRVKYFLADSVSQLFNMTWAGQTFGAQFESDGRLKGEEHIDTVQCDTTNGVCNVRVPAPGFALVYLSDSAFSNSQAKATQTYSTTAVTKTMNTATIDSTVLATSNGMSAKDRKLGSTSKGSSDARGHVRGVVPALSVLGAGVAAVGVLVRVFAGFA